MVGTMAKIDDSVKKKVPELRFKGFTDDWEERKLGELSNIVGGGTPSTSNSEYWDGDIDWYAPAEIGEQRYVSKSKKTITELGLKKSSARILPVGTVLFTSRAGIGNTAILGKEATTNQGFQSIVPNPNKLDSYFIYSRTNELKRYGEVTGAGSTFVEISGKQMSKMSIMVPELSEQKKIGSFFEQLDNTIALHQRKLDLLKEQKKGYLQKMFPKNGAKVPELRFAGFADDWEERKLSSMTNYKNGKSHEDKQSTSGKLELINLNSISISGGLKHSGKFIDEADDTLQKDDLVMILSDVGHGDLLGRVALIPEDDRFVLNQRVALLRPNTTADPQFLFSYINAHQYYFKAQGAGMSQLNISKGSVENFISFVPIIEEQKKIGSFFKQLDETIALHQRKLDLLKEQKKGFLQKMFV
uniref:Type I R/M system specificity subunit n=3 Tax=Lactococcus lactis TaxID=1358 RepID=Q8GRC4_LACLL|nr:restriction endonuclease subunit S [Lactococcus lactis]BAC11874.2 type I R/M system specificity subunit [Lactococcus lactis subsp. lactis bv. diacetylactis]